MHNILLSGFVAMQLLLQCCGSDRDNQYIDREMVPELTEAKAWMGLSEIESDVGFVEGYKNNNTAVAACRVFHNDTRRPVVTVIRSWWHRVDRDTRVYILIHELGHCEWKLGHTDNERDIMYPYYNYPAYLWKYADSTKRTYMIFEMHKAPSIFSQEGE